ncbi:GNAT family N-acetyltransferase [Cohnella sp. LGH]|uniref:GNAT family N-acetyltransferase n=1 Tax=Cohnella sp. LGH TaxID=1619153 RepID=UPI001FFE2873
MKIMDRYDPNEQLSNVINTLQMDKEISRIWMGPAYTFNEIGTDYTDATLVTENNKFYLEHGFSSLLSELESREPCYMVMENNMAVSVCFSARSSDRAAEAGVETLEGYRGKGYAIRVASSWAQAIRQSQRIPMYSTSWDNYSSQSVAKRLQLHLYGTDILYTRIYKTVGQIVDPSAYERQYSITKSEATDYFGGLSCMLKLLQVSRMRRSSTELMVLMNSFDT